MSSLQFISVLLLSMVYLLEIKGVYLYRVERVFTKSNLFPQILSIYYINTRKTKFQQFSAIIEDKGIIQGIYSVYKNIFFNQLRLQALDNPYSSIYNNFTNQLQLAYSNQLTIYYIRLVKQKQAYIGYSFNSWDQLLSIPTWFYIKINLYNTIIRTYLAPKDY